MMDLVLAVTFGSVNFAAMTYFGRGPVLRAIEAWEGKRELVKGSSSQLRRAAGIGKFLFWATLCIFLSAPFFDWGIYGDFDAAMMRFVQRLEVMIELLAAAADD